MLLYNVYFDFLIKVYFSSPSFRIFKSREKIINLIMALEKAKVVGVFVFFTTRVIVHSAVQVKRLLTKLGVSLKAIELDTESM